MDAAAAEVSGRTCLAQAMARRLSTPRGRLIYDPNYGYDLTGEINDDVTPRDIARITANVNTECLKDERVVATNVTATFANSILVVTIVLTDGQGPFTLVLAVTAVTVTLLQVSQ
jgi:phage baseplate assembly protein W